MDIFLPIVAGAFVALTFIFLFLGLRRLFGPNRLQEAQRSMIDQITRSEIEIELEANNAMPNNTWTGFWYNQSRRAGIVPRTPEQPGMIAGGAVLLGLLFGLFVWPGGLLSGFIGAVIEAGGLVAGLYAYYSVRANRRLRSIEKALPTFLQGIQANLNAGQAIQAAILDEADHVEGPLGDELKIVRDEVNVGVTLAQALKNMAGRIDSREVKFLVAAIRIASDTGTGVQKLLSTIQDVLESRQQLANKLASGTVEARLALIVVTAAVPAVFLFTYYSSPQTQQFWGSLIGLATAAAVILLDAIGIFLVKRLVDRVRKA